jgi:hypothetical protein
MNIERLKYEWRMTKRGKLHHEETLDQPICWPEDILDWSNDEMTTRGERTCRSCSSPSGRFLLACMAIYICLHLMSKIKQE